MVGQRTRFAGHRSYSAGLRVEEKVFCCLRIGRFGLLRVLVIADIGRTIIFFIATSGREQEFTDRRDKRLRREITVLAGVDRVFAICQKVVTDKLRALLVVEFHHDQPAAICRDNGFFVAACF